MDDDTKDYTNKDYPLDGSKITVSRRVKNPKATCTNRERDCETCARKEQQKQQR